MERIIIFEDIMEALISMFFLLKSRRTDTKYILVKCDYNHNCQNTDADSTKEKIKHELNKAARKRAVTLNDENIEYGYAATPEDLECISDFTSNDIFLLDVSLFDGMDGKGNKEFNEYSSVRFAKELETEYDIPSNRIRFYTRDTSTTDIHDFTRLTDGKWKVPVLRPANLDGIGNEEAAEMFISKLLSDLEDK